MGKVLTPEQITAVPTPSRPWVEPTDVVPVPTPEEMQTWSPDPAPDMVRFRWEVNIQTGERKAIELTLDEYRARHVAKIVSKNEYVLRKREEERKARRQAILDRLIDDAEKQDANPANR
jgi:hypothetical protein